MKTIIKVPAKLPRFSFQQKRGGAGFHEDKRTNRNRSRGDQRRNALREQE